MEEKKGCQRPDQLSCTPEQIKKCHGSEPGHACVDSNVGCQKPEELTCTPEQIKKCHGSEKDHPCTG